MARRGGAGRGRGRGGARDCSTYKFLGQCDKQGTSCKYQHEVIARPGHREILPVPAGMSIGMVIGRGGYNLKQLRDIAPCGIIVEKKRVLIGTASRENLQLQVQKMKQILLQEHVSGPSWSFLHPDGVSSQGVYQFIPYRGRTPVRAQGPGIAIYELYGNLSQGGSYEDDIVERLAAMSPPRDDDTREGLQSKLRQVHGDTEGEAERLTWRNKTRICPEPQKKVKESLASGLRLLCDKRRSSSFVTRLDARFGKVTWSKFPEEVYSRKFNIQELAELLFQENPKPANIFNTDVKDTGSRAIHARLRQCPSYVVETFDVKLTSNARVGEEDGARLDIRLLVRRNKDGSPGLKVELVKKNEIKDMTFDIMNLHRQHDVRIGLHHYECVNDGEPLYGVVREVVGRIAFPSRHRVRFQPKTSRWNVHLIRHKRKTTYIMDEGFAVTVATVSEHSFDVKSDEAVEFDLRMDTKETHAEVELHNLPWECAFGRDAGFSPSQALGLHVEQGAADVRQFDTIPHPWEAASVLRDLDLFWAHLETLTAQLDEPQ